jgi:hypothetical protein
MRFAAVARVAQDRWTACAVRDEIDFGLNTGEHDIHTVDARRQMNSTWNLRP